MINAMMPMKIEAKPITLAKISAILTEYEEKLIILYKKVVEGIWNGLMR
ncbi:hypothetical protein ABE288_04780 [Bacillus salipaludis]